MPSLQSLLGKPSIHPFPFYTSKILFLFLIALVLIKLVAGISIPYVITAKTPTTALILAAIFATAGFSLYIAAMASLGKGISMGLPNHKITLKTKGVYAMSRHPIYSSLALLYVAATLYLFSITALIITIITIAIQHAIILAEEQFLDEHFGQEYQDYKQKVRRYLLFL